MAEKDNNKNKDAQEEQAPSEKVQEIPPVETQHSIKVGKKTLKYTATTGMMPLKNDDSGDIEANVFFMAYTLDGTKNVSERPLTFVFNGGPGSSSVWLHLGALGPKRVDGHDAGWMTAPPYKLVDNDYTWLDQTDLVFIDPIGTGYSRAVKADDNKNYWNAESDIESVGEFIRMYLTRYQRWISPLFIAGESYGTFRAAGLAGHLFNKGIAFNGIVLISTILNMQTARFTTGNDLPYALFLPTYAATAWFHGKLSKEMQDRPLREFLDEVEQWAATDYTTALAKGDQLTEREHNTILRRLARYTGLDRTFIDNSNLRIHIQRFCKELLRDEKRTVGRLDGRMKGRDALAVTEFPDYDALFPAIMPAYTSTFNDYIRRELGYEIDRPYHILRSLYQNWEYERGQFPDTSEPLRSAMAKNPFMKVFVGQGYYDLGTPHFAAEYTFNHMALDPEVRDNVQMGYYESGHMYYLDMGALAQFRENITGFIQNALKQA